MPFEIERGERRLPEALRREIAAYLERHGLDVCCCDVCESADVLRAPGSPRRMAKAMAVCESAAMPCSLEEFLKEKDAGFTEKLLELIGRRGMKNSAVYKKANISRQHFSKIILDPNARPSKATAIALALALELDLEETRDLIGRAGYALTNSSIFDLIVRYFIERKQYDVVQINMALYEFDQSLLGG